jgi:hypothetical protein
MKRDHTPWKGMEVIVQKKGHAMRGYHAVVQDVQQSQETLSGLKVTVQFMHLNPANPFNKQVLDYDDIVEVR